MSGRWDRFLGFITSAKDAIVEAVADGLDFIKPVLAWPFQSAEVTASAVAIVFSGYALLQGSQQLDVARAALKSEEQNGAFVGFVEKLSAYCGSLVFAGSNDRFTWSPMREGDRVKIYAEFGPIENRLDIMRRQETGDRISKARDESRELFKAVQDSEVLLQVWFEDGQFMSLRYTMVELRKAFQQALEYKAPEQIEPQHYLRVAAKCFGTRDAIIAWYKKPEVNLKLRLPREQDVTLAVRPGSN
ncbi:hypothetical protein [Sinorhizobium fredii]|uniref:hypothetical protein n=1 Tax=Rhizobium fredii TaxID=380 RepID=UPI00129711D4|nr:hypothetical protein [Sinorhizobium fredii]MQW94035.1 hypothetical protein [Sinorhizobium fredii]